MANSYDTGFMGEDTPAQKLEQTRAIINGLRRFKDIQSKKLSSGDWWKSQVSLDTPKDQDAVDVANDIAVGFTPGLGTLQAGRDFERSRREGSELGMGLSALGMLPFVGGVTKLVKGAGVGAKVKALRGTIPDIAESYAERAKETLGPDWNVSVANSHTPIGKSSYVKVGRADNGTSVNKELRVSDHSTGPLRFKDYDLHVDSLDVDKMAEWDAILKDATSRWDFRPSQTEILQRNISRAEKELSVDGQTWGASRKKEAKKRLAAMKARALQDVENLDDKK